MENRGLEGYRGDLNRRCVTIAEALRPAGYRTYAVGKWHVTPGASAKALEATHNWPLQRGFDRYYGTIHGAGSYWDRVHSSGTTGWSRPPTTRNISRRVLLHRRHQRSGGALPREHVRMLQETVPALRGVHRRALAMHARESDIVRYRGRYDAGYEQPARRGSPD